MQQLTAWKDPVRRVRCVPHIDGTRLKRKERSDLAGNSDGFPWL